MNVGDYFSLLNFYPITNIHCVASEVVMKT
jgi:hypothetical protein